MNHATFKKYIQIPGICLILMITCFTFSCKKSMDANVDPFSFPPDLVTKVSSSVSGFVTDQNDTPVSGAAVKMGSSSVFTDQYGFFEIKNVQVVKSAAVVTISVSGYFKSIKTYLAEEGKAAFFRIKLLPKTNAGTFSASAGGSVSQSNGLQISFPANAVKDPATGAIHTGTVNVAAVWIDPTSAELHKIMPGDLRGINTAGLMKGLTTYGMAAIELTAASGELLQIADGKKATITMPLPASLLTSAPASIPLWYFDEAAGLWKEEGLATKTGNNYVGEVNHFSFWNCDVPNNFIQFNCTIRDVNNNPIPNVQVKITDLGTSVSALGLTDAFGYVAGAIPPNASLRLQVFMNQSINCDIPFHEQQFSTTSSNISLGNITVSGNSTNGNLVSAMVTGTVTGCNSNNPVTNGYIYVKENNQFSKYPLSSNGTYSFMRTLCPNSSSNIILSAEDLNALQQSALVNYTITPGVNAVSNIQACGLPTNQFIHFSVDGTSYAFNYPADSIYHYYSPTGIPNQLNISGNKGNPQGFTANFRFSDTGIAVNSNQLMTRFVTNYVSNLQSSSFAVPLYVHITELGTWGEYISGQFSGTFNGTYSVNTPYNVVCNFRVRRTF